MNDSEIPESLRQVSPGNTGSVAVQHRLDKQAVIFGCAAHMAFSSGQEVFDTLPLVVTESVSSCWHLLLSQLLYFTYLMTLPSEIVVDKLSPDQPREAAILSIRVSRAGFSVP